MTAPAADVAFPCTARVSIPRASWEAEKGQDNAPGDLDCQERQTEDGENCRVEDEELVHEAAGHGYGDECLPVDLRSCLPLGHCRKYRHGKERIENNQQGSKGIVIPGRMSCMV